MMRNNLYKYKLLCIDCGKMWLKENIQLSRIFVIAYIVILYILVTTIFRYIYTLFLMYCVVYTMSDMYKKRRRFLWITRFICGNIRFVAIGVIGQDVYNCYFGAKKRLKSKPIKI